MKWNNNCLFMIDLYAQNSRVRFFHKHFHLEAKRKNILVKKHTTYMCQGYLFIIRMQANARTEITLADVIYAFL